MENTNHRSRIAAFFENKSVFITGSTGFIGKMIVLKLLRSCPSTCHIYVLIREKKQKTAKERLEDMLGTEVKYFDYFCFMFAVTKNYIFFF